MFHIDIQIDTRNFLKKSTYSRFPESSSRVYSTTGSFSRYYKLRLKNWYNRRKYIYEPPLSKTYDRNHKNIHLLKNFRLHPRVKRHKDKFNYDFINSIHLPKLLMNKYPSWAVTKPFIATFYPATNGGDISDA